MRVKSGPKIIAAKKSSGGLVETVKTVVYAVLIALVVRTVAYEPFNIPSGSMVPTLLTGDYLFVSKFSYGFSRYSLPFGFALFSGRISVPGLSHLPQRGDVVVFKVPTDNTTDFIKRVVGLPGDHIQMRHGQLYINDQEVPRKPAGDYEYDDNGRVIVLHKYVESLPRGPGQAAYQHPIIKVGDDGPLDNTRVYDVPPDHYFMMGDNRDNSEDSRVGFGGACRVVEEGAPCYYVPAPNLVGKAQFLFFSTSGKWPWWEFWMWPFEIRYGRLFNGVH